jgi:hypothetical protein
MTEDRKTRADAWQMQLTEEQRCQVLDRSRAFPWYTVTKWIEEKLKVRAPSRAAYYKGIEDIADHEAEYSIRARLRTSSALEREFKAVGAIAPEKLVAALGNDVIAARARGDQDAVARAIRAYSVTAKIVGDTRTFDLKVKEFEQAQRDFELKRQDMEIKLRRLELLEAKLREASDTGATVDPKALADEVDRILGRKT